VSGETAGILLTVAGVASELCGLGLVVGGILKDRSKARELFANVVVRSPPARSYARAGGVEAVVGGPNPTTEQRVERLKVTTKALAKRLKDRLHEEQVKRDKAIDEATREAVTHTDNRDKELRQHLADVLVADMRGRVTGAVLFATGVVLSGAGNIVLA
jgi:hypothetical protein